MKKVVVVSVAIIALVVVAVWNYQPKGQVLNLSDLTLENIDALAESEYPTISGFNDKVVFKEWNTNYQPPVLQTVCFEGGNQVCA